ncbi:MAG: hypothetical protein QXO82_05625 [Candidatus Methanomethylicia archaeon]
MEAIRPKQRILYYIWRKGGVEDNISALSRALDYKDDQPVRIMVNDLIKEGCLQIKENRIKITQKGMNKIVMYIFPRFLLPLFLTLSVTFISYGMYEIFFGIEIPPITFIFVGIVILIISLFMLYFNNKLEKNIIRI